MDLFGGLPDQVRKNLVERSKGVIESDEPCEKHPRYVKLIMPDNRLICPVCYRDERDERVAAVKEKEYYENSVDGRRQYLNKNSIVSNKSVLDKGFKTFFRKGENEERVATAATMLVEPIASGEPMNLYLNGAPGCGKTHLSMAILKNANALANGKRCLFVNFPALQQKIRASYNNDFSDAESEGDYIQKMIDADILVLDDIATEINPMTMQGRISDFSDRILYSVMDARVELKPTIITSNVAWNDLGKLIDPRLYSRMSNRLKLISFANIQDKRVVDFSKMADKMKKSK